MTDDRKLFKNEATDFHENKGPGFGKNRNEATARARKAEGRTGEKPKAERRSSACQNLAGGLQSVMVGAKLESFGNSSFQFPFSRFPRIEGR